MNEKKRFAEESSYFDTTVSPSKSMGEIQELLDDFGAESVMVASGQAGGKRAWVVRFAWLGRPYRFLFTPLECRMPGTVRTWAGKKRTNEEQSRYQMGRIAVHFTKAILTAAQAHPHALFGFMELEIAPGVHPTAGELNIDGLLAALPSIDVPQLSDYIEGQIEEIKP